MGKGQEAHRQKAKRPYLIIILAVAVSIPALYFYFRTVYYTADETRASDIAQVNAEAPECLLLSMLPTEHFSAEDFEYFRGISTVKASHRFENLYDIRDFFDALEVRPDHVYLVLDSASIGSRYGFHASLYGRAYQDTLLPVVRENTDTSYEILLPYYSLEYWKKLSEREREDMISSYRDFVNIFCGEPNIMFYFLGAEEWLIANPENYETESACNEAVTGTIVAFTIRDDTYRLTAENMEDRFGTLRQLAGNKSPEPLLAGYDLALSADLADMDIVFFGDSVIGNFTDSTSIPGVVAGLSGAAVYNFGVGGTTAAYGGDPEEMSLLPVVEAFLSGDVSMLSDEQHVKRDIGDYISGRAEGEARSTCFILNFGLNDYFTGVPVYASASEDAEACYTGALRSAVTLLEEAYPGCRIILMTPNYSAEFHGGTDVQSPAGGTLSDYADAVWDVAEEKNVEVIDNFKESGIDGSNVWTYISDGTHPNELGRYIIGRRIVRHLKKQREFAGLIYSPHALPAGLRYIDYK